VSGLKGNLAKLELGHVGNVDNVAGLVGILGCGVVSLLMKYLGFLLGASYKAKHLCDGFGKLKSLCKLCFIVWTAAHGKILTLGNLKKR
jgi:hypothetical protein